MLREENEKKNGGAGTYLRDKASYPTGNIPKKCRQCGFCRIAMEQPVVLGWQKSKSASRPFEGVVGGEPPSSTPVLGVTCSICLAIPAQSSPRAVRGGDRRGVGSEVPGRSAAPYRRRALVSSPFEEADLPENPIRRLVIGSSLLERRRLVWRTPRWKTHRLTTSTENPDFKIKTTKKGDYNSYGNTSERPAGHGRCLRSSQVSPTPRASVCS